MGKCYDAVSAELGAWLCSQKVFFVATAPLAQDGHINCSPKGSDTFRVLNEREVAYLDLTGSGVETIAHIQENGRIILMFCAFDGPPKVVRLHGRAQVVYPAHPEFAHLSALFPAFIGSRAIIRVTLERISDSCGYAVPRFDFVQERTGLESWSRTKGEAGLASYREEKNRESLDGLPGYANGES